MAKARSRPRIQRLNSEPLGELAYRSIRESIIAGRLEQGEKLVEAGLADELGVSRAPVREALRRLAEEGLVVERPRHGVSARKLSGRDFVDIYNLRLAIERAAVRLVVRREGSLAQLEDAIGAMRACAREGDVEGTAASERRFHEVLCRESGNPFLGEVFDRVAALIEMALALDDSAYENLEDVAAEHEPVLDALREGDEREAVRRIEEHILLTVDAPLARLGGSRDDLLGPLH